MGFIGAVLEIWMGEMSVKRLFVLCLFALLLAACGPEEVCCIDCIKDLRAWAWVDENENGVWDQDEVPLADVDFNFAGRTNSKGLAQGYVMYGGCNPTCDCGPPPTIEVYPVIPEGYRLTTPSAKSRFGFVKIPDP